VERERHDKILRHCNIKTDNKQYRPINIIRGYFGEYYSGFGGFIKSRCRKSTKYQQLDNLAGDYNVV